MPRTSGIVRIRQFRRSFNVEVGGRQDNKKRHILSEEKLMGG